MNRTSKISAAVLAACGLSLTGATTAGASPTHASDRLTKSDTAFLKSNEQVNLAEITLGKIVLRRSDGPHARELARVTIRDHRKAEQEVKSVARKDGVVLPTAPNAAQQKVAAALRAVPSHVALTYFRDQVAGHKTSIAATKSELKNGSKRNVLRYARAYLPVAQMHLRMSETDLHRLQNR